MSRPAARKGFANHIRCDTVGKPFALTARHYVARLFFECVGWAGLGGPIHTLKKVGEAPQASLHGC